MTALFGNRPVLFERVALYPGSFDPINNNHLDIIAHLCSLDVDKVIVWPVGPYGSKMQRAPHEHRREMIIRATKDFPDVVCRFDDLERERGYTSNYRMQMDLSVVPQDALRDELMIPLAMPMLVREIWHVIGADNVGSIRSDWNEGDEMWRKARFLIVPCDHVTLTELPNRAKMLPISARNLRCKIIRHLIRSGEDRWQSAVPDSVAEYILKHSLYRE